MAEAPKAAESKAAEKTEKPPKKKSLQATNCAQCNIRIRRKSWYYHNQKYFCGPNCSKTHLKKMQDEKAKAAAEKAAAVANPASEEPKAA